MVTRTPFKSVFISRKSGYLIALVAVVAMIGIRYAMSPFIEVYKAPFMTMYACAFVAAFYGGMGPTVLATVLSTIFAVYMLELNPATPLDSSLWISVVLNVLTAFCMGLFSLAQQKTQQAALNSANAALEAERKLRQSERALHKTGEELLGVAKLQQETNSQLESLLANAPVAIAFFDRDGRYVRINKFLAELKGIPIEDHIGRSVVEVLPQLGEQLEPIIRKIVATGEGEEHFETSVPMRQGSTRTRSWIIGLYPVKDNEGEVKWVGAVGIEITRQKEIEREIRRLNQTLEQKVRDRTEELSAANEELQGFTYSVSHDLRAPLRAIIASSRFILEDYGDELDENGRQLMTKQADAAKRLAELIDDMLRYARLSRAELVKKPIDLGRLFTDITQSIGEQYEHAAKLTVSGPMSVEGDPMMLRMAMENLIDNAYKYRNRDRNLEIALKGEAEDGRVKFMLKDNGIGFDPNYSAKLFQPFERLHRKEDYPGTGIGLANVKRVIERHGGSVEASGMPGEGATFIFTL